MDSKGEGTPGRPPLAGIRVLDFGRAAQVPYAAQLLGDFGAEVIKIEAEDGGIRGSRPQLAQAPSPGEPAYHGRGDGLIYRLALNRNKKSIVLDLKSEEGKETVRRLVRISDVVMENFRPDVMDRLGLGYEALRQLNPRLIYVGASAYGARGPMAHMGGGDLMVQALGGLAMMTGPDDGPPVLIGSHVVDMNGAMYVVAGTLLALLARGRDGVGQKVECNLLSSNLALQSIELLAYWLAGSDPPRVPQGHSEFSANYYIYECADGRWITASFGDWEHFLAVLGLDDLIGDPRYDTAWKRVIHRDELVERVRPMMKTKSSQEWLALAREHDYHSQPVLSYSEIAALPQTNADANDDWVTVQQPMVGEITMVNVPIHLSLTPGSVREPVPPLGAHTDEVLRMVGLAEGEVESRPSGRGAGT